MVADNNMVIMGTSKNIIINSNKEVNKIKIKIILNLRDKITVTPKKIKQKSRGTMRKLLKLIPLYVMSITLQVFLIIANFMS